MKERPVLAVVEELNLRPDNYAIALLSFVCIPLVFLIRRTKKGGAPVHVPIGE